MNWTDMETKSSVPEFANCYGRHGVRRGNPFGLCCEECAQAEGCRRLSNFDRQARRVEARENRLLWEITNQKPELEYR